MKKADASKKVSNERLSQALAVSSNKTRVKKDHVGTSGSSQLVPKQEQHVGVRQAGEFRRLKPAENYDVVSFARAMNDDFAPRLKKLFDPETDAAKQAIQTGIYIGWRCPEFKHDCQRVSSKSRCFCGHLLEQHDKYMAGSNRVKCVQDGCACRAFAWIPSRAEDVGEFWLNRRPDFDPTAWRAKCRCKHTHEQHRADSYKCTVGGCRCYRFDSNFLCAACDRHWEKHETFFESAKERSKNGMPIGEEYIPFAEIPQLRDIAMSGKEATDEEYRAITAMFHGTQGAAGAGGSRAIEAGTVHSSAIHGETGSSQQRPSGYR